MTEYFKQTISTALLPPPDLTVSEWADLYRQIDAKMSVDGIGGQWSTDTAPYQRGPMDAYSNTEVDTITLMWGTQLGKTEILYNMMGWAVDMDPTQVLYVMPTQETCRGIVRKRIIPIFKKTSQLSKHLSGHVDDISIVNIILDGCDVNFAWSNSPATLAANPIPRIFFDEADKMARFSGREASPLSLGTERTKNFWNRKVVLCSTPTTRDNYIYDSFKESNQMEYYVPCPHCGHWHVLSVKQIKWNPEDSRERIRTLSLAWYICPNCEEKITDREKIEYMLPLGVWCPKGCTVDWGEDGEGGVIVGEWPKNTHWGFHLSSLYSPWITWSMVAAEKIKAGNIPKLLMNFVNSWLAEIWEELVGEKIESTALDALVSGEFEEGEVPSWGQVLYAGVDVQKDRFYLTVQAWGSEGRVGTVFWKMLSGGTFDQLDTFRTSALFRRKGDGTPMRVRGMGIDRRYRTDEVDKYCLPLQGWAYGVMGAGEPCAVPYQALKISRDPNTGNFIRGGLMYWRIDTIYYKDWIHRMILADPQQWFLHNGITSDYMDHVVSEHKILDYSGRTPKPKYIIKPGGGENHGLDATVYALFVAELNFANMITGDVQVVQSPDYITSNAGYNTGRG